MKISINWLFIALLFVCLHTSKAQTVNLSMNTNTPQYITPSTAEPKPSRFEKKAKVPTLHMTNSPDIMNPSVTENKGGRIEATPLDVVIDAAIDGWDAVFKTEKVKMNAFDIDTVIDMRPQPKPTAKPKSREVVQVESPVHIESFDFATAKMTVKMVNGQFVEAPQNDSVAQVGKGIVENTFNIDVVEDADVTNFFSTNTFVYNGEIYKRVSLAEFEAEEYKKPRVKKAKNKSITIAAEPFRHSPTPTSNEDFIDDYEDAALDGERYGIPYSITMAQGILESRGGRSRMAVALNNLFGVKCGGGRCNKSGCKHGYYTDDRADETFVRYSSYDAAFKGHVKFFLDNERYQKCLSCGVNDIECWLYYLQRSGYATDKTYDYKLAEIINRYKLTPKPIHYNRKTVKARL